MINYQLLLNAPRLLMKAPLAPMQGDRFQPTGFADLGAAEYTLPGGTRMLLVESAQSVANRLEKTCVDDDGLDLIPELKGLSYVAATLSGGDLQPIRTTSLVEAHRIASPYFIRGKFGETLSDAMGYGKGPLNWKKIYAALFKYDANSLLHGVFLSLLGDGRVKVPRALTGFIEARDVAQVVSGGVKNSPVDPTGSIQVEGDTKDKGIYSNVPYARIEYTAREINACFNVDTSQIRSYGLPEAGQQLLLVLAIFKIRRFLDRNLRLRTFCDLKLAGEIEVIAPSGCELASEQELLGEISRLIPDCKHLFSDPAVTELQTKVTVKDKEAKKGKKGKTAAEEATDAGEDEE